MLQKTKQAIERYSNAAEQIGWKFLRKSTIKDKVFISHDACGKEQEVYTSGLISGNIKCKHCQLVGYAKAASKNGWEWLGMNDHTYSRYRHRCGYEKSIQMASMDKQRPVCDKCQSDKILKEAENIGWTFVRKVDKDYGEYLHNDCGCVSVLQMTHVRGNSARCMHCLTEDRKQSAHKHGFEFNRAVSGHLGEYKHSCGNVSNFQFTHMRSGAVKCKHCYESKLSDDIDSTDWKWLARSGNGTSLYKHMCGHHQSIKHALFHGGNVGVVCRSCQTNWYDIESNIYILLFTSEKGKAVKVGFAKSHEQRKYTFNMADGVSCEVVLSIPVKSGRAAILKEKGIHKSLEHIRLTPDIGKLYLSSGFTEMYPADNLQYIRDFVISQCADCV